MLCYIDTYVDIDGAELAAWLGAPSLPDLVNDSHIACYITVIMGMPLEMPQKAAAESLLKPARRYMQPVAAADAQSCWISNASRKISRDHAAALWYVKQTLPDDAGKPGTGC